MINVDQNLKPKDLQPALSRFFELAAGKIRALNARWDPGQGTPVFTVRGAYTSRGWTEWTQGFQFGNAIYQFDATDETEFLEMGRRATVDVMASHVSHIGVHDHGFNNISTYGNLLRLMAEGRIPPDRWEREFYRLAIKVSGAVQASRWTPTADGLGFIHSFNGPHSLFSDTMRTLRVLALAHRFGHTLMGEQDQKISLLRRLLQHAEASARYNVYFGTGRDSYDTRGRVVHESIFNVHNGVYRCPSTQQGYTPFSTWTRGLSWVLCGCAEQLEFLATLTPQEIIEAGVADLPDHDAVMERFVETAGATADFFIDNTPSDGVPYWDTGAPGLSSMTGYLDRPADPYNDSEPVDSSAAAICAQGYLRLGRYLSQNDQADAGARYFQTGLTIARTLLAEPYLSTDPGHEGLLLHSIYHQPNGWDHVPAGHKVAHGESCMWGDYHLMELAVYLQRIAADGPYLTFFAV